MDTTYESKLDFSDDDEIQLEQPQEKRKPERFEDAEERVAENLTKGVWRFLAGIWNFLKTIFSISITTVVLAVLAVFAVAGIICLLLAIAVIAIAFAVILVPIGGLILGTILAMSSERFEKFKKEVWKKP